MRDLAETGDVLSRLLEDARRDPTPAMEWDSVERALMHRVSRERVTRSAPSRPAWVWAAAIAAGVAAGSIGVALRKPQSASDRAVAVNSPHPGTIDGSKLLAGAVIEASGYPVAVEHAGRATWVVEPSSVAHLQSGGEIITVALDRGALSARVVKVPRSESFVVLADRTRIAVHGTAFRVERMGSEVHVHVEEGVVAVGPVGTRGFEVPAPGDVVTTLDGVRASERPPTPMVGGEHAGAQPEERTSAEGEARAGIAGERSKSRVHAESGESGHPRPNSSPTEVGPTAQRAVAAVRACFAAQTRVDQGDLKISATTTLSLHVLPNGTVVEARFEPPLAPGVQQCVDAALGKMQFPESSKGLSIQRSIDLGR